MVQILNLSDSHLIRAALYLLCPELPRWILNPIYVLRFPVKKVKVSVFPSDSVSIKYIVLLSAIRLSNNHQAKVDKYLMIKHLVTAFHDYQ